MFDLIILGSLLSSYLFIFISIWFSMLAIDLRLLANCEGGGVFVFGALGDLAVSLSLPLLAVLLFFFVMV